MLPTLLLQSIRNDDENGKSNTGETENEADNNKDVRNMRRGVEGMIDRDNTSRGNHERKMDDNIWTKAVFSVLRSATLHHNDGNSGQGNRDERMKSLKESHDDESHGEVTLNVIDNQMTSKIRTCGSEYLCRGINQYVVVDRDKDNRKKREKHDPSIICYIKKNSGSASSNDQDSTKYSKHEFRDDEKIDVTLLKHLDLNPCTSFCVS